MKKKLAPVPQEKPDWCCAECWYFETQSADTGICFGVPPQSTVKDGEHGFARPLVDPSDRGCALFTARHKA